MRFFDEETGGKPSKETCVILPNEEAKVIIEAMELYCKQNPKKRKAKALLSEMDKKWGLW